MSLVFSTLQALFLELNDVFSMFKNVVSPRNMPVPRILERYA
jgi:hypothetical protein